MNVTVYITTIDVVSFYTSAHYSSIEIILEITIIAVSCITFTLMLISIVVNNFIYNARGNEFVFLCLEQMVINLDIFI